MFIFIVIGFGLIFTAMEGVETAGLVKPHHDPEEGRLISHMKNTTYVSGNAAEIHEKLKEAIPYKEAQTAEFAPNAQNWKEFFKNSINARPSARHVIVLPSGDLKRYNEPFRRFFMQNTIALLLFLQMKLKGMNLSLKTEKFM